MFSTIRRRSAATNTDEAGHPIRFNNRKEDRARKKGCKSCAFRIKGTCRKRLLLNKFPIKTRKFKNDPRKVKCEHWTMHQKNNNFAVPNLRAPINKESGRNGSVTSNARSRLKPTKPYRKSDHGSQAQQEE